MQIFTCFNPAHSTNFRRLSRKTSGGWKFLVSGEWSQSPYHQGNHRFYVRYSRDKRCWALLSAGFPNRIVAVGETDGGIKLEVIAAEMMRMVRCDGQDYIDVVEEYGRLDHELLLKLYWAKPWWTPKSGH